MGMRATQSNKRWVERDFRSRSHKSRSLDQADQWYSVSSRTSKFYWRPCTSVIGKRALEIGGRDVENVSVSNDAPYSNVKHSWRIAGAAIMLNGIQPQINELSDTLEASTEY